MRTQPLLFEPPAIFVDSKTHNIKPFDSDMVRGLKNARYNLHYDYSAILDRRALAGSDALLSPFPADIHKATGGGTTPSSGQEHPSFLHYPETAVQQYVARLTDILTG